MDKIVHYSKMSKTLEKPRKSFPERWEPSQKRAGSASPTCGGNGAWRPVCFSDRPWRQHFTDPFSVYCVLPQTHTTVRISDSCPVSLPWASIQKYAVCMASSCRASKNRSERRVGGHKAFAEHGRTQSTSPFTSFLHAFQHESTLISMNLVKIRLLLSGANTEKTRISA